ncbi:MAG: ABC transporter permease [Bacteroidota bacterium]
MLTSYLRTALRFFRRQKGYTALNVLGLAVGLACAFFILLWMQDELRTDRFHAGGDRLYIVKRHMALPGAPVLTGSAVTKPVADVLEADFPEVEYAERTTWPRDAVLAHGEVALRDEGLWADSSFFEMFSFPLLAGDPATALDRPDGIVLSERAASVLFPDRSPDGVIGQTVRVDDRRDFQVTGVAAEVPAYSSLQFDWVLPSRDYYERNAWVDHWGNSGLQLHVRLTPGADRDAVNAKIERIIPDNFEGGEGNTLFLQPFGEQHLYNQFEDGEQAGGRIEYVRIFGVVALFLLLIACINFTNLATARSAQRAREIGVRKTLGASRGKLVGQFLAEAVLTALGALALAAAVVAVLLPLFSEVAGKEVTLGSVGTGMWLGFVGLAVGAGLLAGAYPALVLSGFDPAGVLRGSGGTTHGSALLRKSLVVFQFAASILLIVGTFVVYQQIDFIQTKNLGLDRANVVSMRLEGGAHEQYDAFRRELLARPGIVSVSVSNSEPFRIGSSTTDPEWDGKAPESKPLFHVLQTHYGFPETMRMEMAAGRTFSRSFGADSANFVVNEAAARVMGMETPVGERLSMWGRDGQIVGLVKDFHMASLYDPIEPTILLLDQSLENLQLLAVRTAPGQTEEAIAALRETFAAFSPGVPFDYAFMDATYGEMYESEQRIGTLANLFAAVAAFIACLGLFGLAAYAAERRRKEVGVRKVLGASVANLVGLLSREFVALVLVACLVALPLAWLGARAWLSDFTFHVDLGAWPFVFAGTAALVLAALTVGVQAYRAAAADPVRALRNE